MIRKTSETRALAGNIVNAYSESQNSTYSCDYVNNMMSYSTNEINTGKIWIDGKPIYRKVFTGTLGTTASNDISFSIDTLIDEGGYVRYGAAYQFPIPSTFGTQGVNDIRLIKKDANTLTLQYGSNLNSQNYAVWIEYTKN